MLNTEPSFDAPIPGMSLTHELGARPWQTPAQFPSVDEAIQYYMESMSSDDFIDELIDIIELGVPLADLANTIQLASVMEGKHNVDVGVLVTPVIIEMLIFLAESAGVEYTVQVKENKDEKISKGKIARVIQQLELATEEKETEEETEDVKEVAEETSTGLMSRR